MGLKTATIPAKTLPLTGTGLHRGNVEVQIAEINSEGWVVSPAEDNVPVLIFGRLPEPGSPVARLYDEMVPVY